MATVTDQVHVVLNEVQLLNAKRYGLGQEDFDKFAGLMHESKEASADELGMSEDAITGRIKDRMQDWVLSRMKNRVMSETDGVYGYEPEQFRHMSAEDLMYDMVGRRDDRKRQDSSGLSSLLNMHFDLNTLQMLNGA
ncbi:MAG: hypothetical protein OQK24_09650 [Magnetovibrio sp.]|nr:hypothetical protein [Magnetovibrio sp.]